MMNKMVVANLVHRPTRSFIAASAIALEVTMILMVVALFYGLLNGSKESQLGVGADLMVMPPGSAGLIGMSGAPISVKVGDVLRKVPHVESAVPVIWWFTQKPVEIIYGIDLASYDTLPPRFRYLSGGPFQGPYDVIVDDYFAGMNHKQVGDVVEILNHQFRICGVVPHGKGGRKFLPLATLQDLGGSRREGVCLLCEARQFRECGCRRESHPADSGDGEILCALDAGVSVDDDPGQFAWIRSRDQDRHRGCGGGGISGDLSIDVHGGDGADARDRNS